MTVYMNIWYLGQVPDGGAGATLCQAAFPRVAFRTCSRYAHLCLGLTASARLPAMPVPPM